VSGGRHFALGAAAGAIGMTLVAIGLLVVLPSASQAGQHPRARAIEASPAIAPCARF
jgi:predicted outer membrane protein